MEEQREHPGVGCLAIAAAVVSALIMEVYVLTTLAVGVLTVLGFAGLTLVFFFLGYTFPGPLVWLKKHLHAKPEVETQKKPDIGSLGLFSGAVGVLAADAYMIITFRPGFSAPVAAAFLLPASAVFVATLYYPGPVIWLRKHFDRRVSAWTIVIYLLYQGPCALLMTSLDSLTLGVFRALACGCVPGYAVALSYHPVRHSSGSTLFVAILFGLLAFCLLFIIHGSVLYAVLYSMKHRLLGQK